MIRTFIKSVGIVLLFVLLQPSVHARTLNNLFVGSLSYAWPAGDLATSTAAKPSLGLSLGYLYRASGFFLIGVKGTWTQLSLGQTATENYSDYILTHVGLYGNVLYRPLKRGWSPYAEVEGGMGFMFANTVIANHPIKIDDLSEVRASTGVSVGFLVPLSDVVDANVAGRWFTTFVDKGFEMTGIHVGIVYAMK